MTTMTDDRPNFDRVSAVVALDSWEVEFDLATVLSVVPVVVGCQLEEDEERATPPYS